MAHAELVESVAEGPAEFGSADARAESLELVEHRDAEQPPLTNRQLLRQPSVHRTITSGILVELDPIALVHAAQRTH